MTRPTSRIGQLQRLLFASSLGLLLAGCASYRSEPISPAENAAALESRTLDNSRLGHFIRASLPSLRRWCVIRIVGVVWQVVLSSSDAL